MFENYKTDETQVTTTPAETSTAKEAEVKQSQTSADSKNTEVKTETDKGPVPYDRFSEVNKKYRDTEAELKDYKDILGQDLSKDEMKAMAGYVRAAKNNPNFAKDFNSAIDRYNQGYTTKQEMKEEIAQAKQDNAVQSDPRIEAIQKTLSDNVIERYKEGFALYADKDSVHEEDREYLENETAREMMSKNRNAGMKYDNTLLKEAYAKAKEKLDKRNTRILTGYVKEKTSDEPPVTKTGTSVSATKEFASRSEESSFVANHLRSLRKSA